MADIELTRVGVLLRAHRAKAIVVPKDLIASIERANDLGKAAVDAWAAHADAEALLEPLFSEVITLLVKDGPYEHPAGTMKEQREEVTLFREDAELLDLASDRAHQSIAPALVAVIPDLAAQLAKNLAAIIAKVRPMVQDLEDVDFADPDAIHDAPEDTQRAFHVFEPLSVKHDHIRRSALAIYHELTSGGHIDGKRRAVLTALDDAAFRGGPRQQHDGWWIGQFAGGGLVGPVPWLRGKGGPIFDARWQWKPGDRHPVQRLVDAVLIPEYQGPPDEDFEVVPPRRGTPVRSAAAILR